MKTQVTKLDFTGQNIFVGMDTHKRNWTVSIEHENLPLKTFSMDPTPEVLNNYLKKHYPGATYHSAYEASYCGYWIHFRLKELGINSIIVNPSDVPITNKDIVQKDDKRDSKKIAKSLRNGDLSSIYVPTKKTIQDRTLIRTRYTLAKELRRFKNRVKSFLFFYGIEYPEEFYRSSTHWSKRFIAWLETLSFEEETAKISLSIYLEQVKSLRATLLNVTREIRKLSKTEDYRENTRLLMTIPGIGLITAMLLLTELEDISRFKSLDQLCSYVGLIPSTSSSGEKESIGEMTPRKHNALRSAIVESSWVAIKHDPALLMCFTNHCKRMESNKAIIRVAKKLLNRIRFVIKNQQEYVISVVK